MKQIDWSALFTGLIALVISIGLSISIIIASQQYYESNKKWGKKQQVNFIALNDEYFRLEDSSKMDKNLYIQRLQKFIDKGFFVKDLMSEERLKVYEEVDKLFNNKLKSLLFEDTSSYEILEQNSYQIPKYLSTTPEFLTYQTPIHFKLALLHEADMLKLLKRVEFHNHKFTGLLNLQSCSIQGFDKPIDTNDVSTPYLNANCIWIWYVSTKQ